MFFILNFSAGKNTYIDVSVHAETQRLIVVRLSYLSAAASMLLLGVGGSALTKNEHARDIRDGDWSENTAPNTYGNF